MGGTPSFPKLQRSSAVVGLDQLSSRALNFEKIQHLKTRILLDGLH
jgi:hypothetical protein